MATGSTPSSDQPAPRHKQPPAFDPDSILSTLRRYQVDFVLIGAYAAVSQGWSEPTSDVDITPDRDVRNMQRLAAALCAMDAQVLTDDGQIDPDWPIDDQRLRMKDTTFFTTRYGDIDVVVNPAATAGYPDLAQPDQSFVISVGGFDITVANLNRVIESKRATDRPKDRDALPRLERLLKNKKHGG